MTLGQKIKGARRAAGLTVVSLASRVGVTERAVRLWESDSREPRFEHMLKIARVTGRSLEEFGEEAPGDSAADQAVHR